MGPRYDDGDRLLAVLPPLLAHEFNNRDAANSDLRADVRDLRIYKTPCPLLGYHRETALQSERDHERVRARTPCVCVDQLRVFIEDPANVGLNPIIDGHEQAFL